MLASKREIDGPIVEDPQDSTRGEHRITTSLYFAAFTK
jgi:hypothetical protein